MATNLGIDPELLDEAFELSGERTKKAAVNLALAEFVARRRRLGFVDLVGVLGPDGWDPDYDHKAERSRT